MYGQQKKDFLTTLDIAVFDIEKYADIFGYSDDEEYQHYLERVKSLKYIFAREMSMDENEKKEISGVIFADENNKTTV